MGGLALLVFLSLFAAVTGLQEVGRQIGLARRRAGHPAEGIAAMEGAAFALLGLLVAFTFYGAATRFDARRQLVVDEINALGTAWLRIDVLPADAQPAVRDAFRAYVDQRIATYRALPDQAAARVHLDSAALRQAGLWSLAVAGSRRVEPPTLAPGVLDPLNQSFDLATARTAAWQMHPPLMIWLLLSVLAGVCCLLSGFDSAAAARRSWFHVVLLSMLLSATIYATVDFEFPRVGLIRLDNFDELMVSLRAGMR